MNAEFHRSRREQFYRNMSDHEALVLFAGSAPRKTTDASYRYFANRNFYYMTGVLQKESVLLAVKRDGDVEDVKKYRWHNGTHHVGLDVHDVGAQPVPIESVMVFTIDVGIYIEEKNIGFRVEDDVVVTATGYEHLSSDIVREIDDIEAMMR